jgi:hypothetical protein
VFFVVHGVSRWQLQLISSTRKQLPARSILRAAAEQLVVSSLVEQPQPTTARTTIER